MKVADMTLGDLRQLVDADPCEDPAMTDFVQACVGYKDTTRCRILISALGVTFVVLEVTGDD